MSRTRFRFAAALTLFALVQPACAAAQAPPATAPTLYQRLGGYDFIASFVDTAFPRVAADPGLTRLFRGHSLDSQRRQRQLIVDALCQATGGPCLYTGRDLTLVHQGLQIGAEDWQAFMAIISRTLAETNLAEGVRRDFLQIFEQRLRGTVVSE